MKVHEELLQSLWCHCRNGFGHLSRMPLLFSFLHLLPVGSTFIEKNLHPLKQISFFKVDAILGGICPPTKERDSPIPYFFSFQNNPKTLDPSYKMDLDFWDC